MAITDISEGTIEEVVGGLATSLDSATSRNIIQVLKSNGAAAQSIAAALEHGEFALGKSGGKYDLWIGGQGTTEAQKVVLTHEFNTAINALKTELNSVLESEVGDAIAAEVAARTAADAVLQTAITAEETARVAGDDALQTAITAEETARIAAVTAEETARTNADNALDARATTLETKTQNITSSGANSTNIAGSLTVGDLTVTGSNTVVDSTTVRTEDSIIELNFKAGDDGAANATGGGVLIHAGNGTDQQDGLIKWSGTDLSFLGGGEVDSDGSLVSGTQKSLLNITENEFSLSDGKVSYTANEFKVNGLTVKADGTVVATEFDGNVDGGNF